MPRNATLRNPLTDAPKSQPPLTLPKAILFDMDGTLTAPMLDFPKIKMEMGIGNRPILEALAEMSPDRRAMAEMILLRHEEHAAGQSTLNPGCHELLNWLAARNIRRALITRNSLSSVRTVLARHRLAMDLTISRDDPPFKPNPHPLRLACANLVLSEVDVWMVGDGSHDVEAGISAGVKTIWLSHGNPRPFKAEPWRAVRDLSELQNLLSDVEEASRRDANSRPPIPRPA
jgi:HAD superfamily hydrolase (TIGR01549 family)